MELDKADKVKLPMSMLDLIPALGHGKKKS